MAVLLLWCAAAAVAKTTVYGWMSGPLNYQMASFDLDEISNEAVPATVQDMPTVIEVISGTTVGNRYYAFYTDDVSYATCFGSFNYETGEVVCVKKYDNSDAPEMKGIVYDASAEVLYGLRYVREFDSEGRMTTSGQLVEVGLKDGSLKVLKTYANDVTYDVLISDGNNGMYWISNEDKQDFNSLPKLYAVNVANDFARELLVDNTEVTYGWANNNNSGIVRDGKVIYIANTTVLEFDLAAKTVAKTGTMKKYVGGLTYSKSTESAEPGAPEIKPVTRLLVRTTWYGDSQGSVGSDVDMTKTEYFYNSDYKISRVVESGRGYDDMNKPTDYSLMYFTKYKYDDNSNLVKTETYQTGLYDFGDMAYRFRSSTEYEYNEKNQLVKEPSAGYILLHEYDDAGNIVKTAKTNAKGDTIQVLEYQEFIGINKPTLVISTSPKHPEWTSYIYTAMIEYDENLNKVKEIRAADSNFETPIMMETWDYDGTFLKLYTKYSSFNEGQPVPSSKTEYNMVDNNPDKIKHVEYSYFDGEWYIQGRPCIDEYADFEDMGEMTATEITAEASADTLNSVKLNISVPEIVYMTGDCDFNIYRNGELIATKNFYDMANEETMALEYTDSMLYNNDYEYFVQPVVAKNAISPFDLEDEEPVIEKFPYCISNVADINVHLELPAVTDLKCGNLRKDDNDLSCVTVSWTNPEYPEEYGFMSNELYFEKYQLADTVTTEAGATELEGKFFESANVFILTRYKYGKAISDTIKVDLAAVGIDAVSSETGATISLNGRELRLSENADVTVYSMSGRMEARATNTGRMDLDKLNSGAYIICVSRNGVTSAHKLVLK